MSQLPDHLRLSSFDLSFLRLESPSTPFNMGGLAILEGGSLLDPSGRLRLGWIRDRINSRLVRAPQLRRRLVWPGLLGGRPVWVDDPEFDIRRHVREAAVNLTTAQATPLVRAAVPDGPSGDARPLDRAVGPDDASGDARPLDRAAGPDDPSGDAQLLDRAAALSGRLLDRRHPLWELWFLTGLPEQRVAALFKLHHAVADGRAAMAILRALLDRGDEVDAASPGSDDGGEAAPDSPSSLQPSAVVSWAAEPAPSGWALRRDNLAVRAAGLGAATRRLGHPRRAVEGAASAVRDSVLAVRLAGAPATSLNRSVRPGRRLGHLCLDLRAVKGCAHRHGARVNDLVLDLYAQGLRRLLLARGERVEGLELMTSVAVPLRTSAAAAGLSNRVGVAVVPLPVGEADLRRRLRRLTRDVRRVQREQHPAAVSTATGVLAATGLAAWVMRHQRWVNVFSTTLVGPVAPAHLLGSRIVAILPIVQIAGNVPLSLCALTYAGRLDLVVTADAGAFPDLRVLIDGMEEGWNRLAGGGPEAGVSREVSSL